MEDLTKAEMEGREQAMHGKVYGNTGCGVFKRGVKPANIFSLSYLLF